MSISHSHPVPVVVVGAGPFGLSVAAHLRSRGVPHRIFGRPMQTWATQMPADMRLKSDGFASNLSGGTTPFTLEDFCAETGRPYHHTLLPVPLQDFIDYGQEFARRHVPTLETDDIRHIERAGKLFAVTVATGERFLARRVVVATGLSLFQHLPTGLHRLASVTHPAQHRHFHAFAGREVTVLGRGASSLNAAVLLHEAGARVTLIARGRRLHIHEMGDPSTRPTAQRLLHPSTPLGTGMRSFLACAAPDLFHALPLRLRRILTYKHLGPAGGVALKGRLEGFDIHLGCRVHAIEPADGSGDRLRITMTDRDGTVRQHLTSHLIAGTGYRIAMERLRFLSADLREAIRVDDRGAPRLRRSFETSVPGLHMVGPVAAPAFGPLLRFVAGAEFAATRVTTHLQRTWLRERAILPATESDAPQPARQLARQHRRAHQAPSGAVYLSDPLPAQPEPTLQTSTHLG